MRHRLADLAQFDLRTFLDLGLAVSTCLGRPMMA
jgi:hypothetical protein